MAIKTLFERNLLIIHSLWKTIEKIQEKYQLYYNKSCKKLGYKIICLENS